MNTKTAIATSVLAATIAMTSAAEAGVRIGFGFPLGTFIAHRHFEAQEYQARRYHALRAARAAEIARLKRQQAIAAARARKEAIAEAKAEKAAAAKAKIAAQTKADQAKKDEALAADTSKTSVATVKEEAKVSAKVKTAANTTASTAAKSEDKEPATKLDCKRYFANVGLTISVPCTD